METKRKNLILYASLSGNTKKVAGRIAKTFEQKGWNNTLVQVDQKYDPRKNPINFDAYDFICVGSGVFWHVPYEPLLTCIRSSTHRSVYGKIIPGPRLGLAFATYGGAHLGPKEAQATLELLEIAFEHLGFRSFGRLAIPGRVRHYHSEGEETPDWYFPDIHNRPDSEDLDGVDTYVGSLLESSEFHAVYGLPGQH
jgi:hypothetical protein